MLQFLLCVANQLKLFTDFNQQFKDYRHNPDKFYFNPVRICRDTVLNFCGCFLLKHCVFVFISRLNEFYLRLHGMIEIDAIS